MKEQLVHLLCGLGLMFHGKLSARVRTVPHVVPGTDVYYRVQYLEQYCPKCGRVHFSMQLPRTLS